MVSAARLKLWMIPSGSTEMMASAAASTMLRLRSSDMRSAASAGPAIRAVTEADDQAADRRIVDLVVAAAFEPPVGAVGRAVRGCRSAATDVSSTKREESRRGVRTSSGWMRSKPECPMRSSGSMPSASRTAFETHVMLASASQMAMTSATASATAASRASAATSAVTSCAFRTMPPIAGSSDRFSAVTSHVCRLPSWATKRSATERPSVPDGSDRTSANHAAASSASAGSTRAKGVTELAVGVAEEFRPTRRAVHDGARVVDDARKIARMRDQARERSRSCVAVVAGGDLGRDVVRDDGDDVAVDGDDVSAEPERLSGRAHDAEFRVHRCAGGDDLVVQGQERGVVSMRVDLREARADDLPTGAEPARTTEFASTTSKSRISSPSRTARSTAKLPRIPSIARR